MRFLFLSTLLALALSGCNPTFNWRDVRPDGTRLSLLMPCKPDKAQKKVPLGGSPTELMMLSCDAGGMTFAVGTADVGDAAKVAAALAQWQAVTLANIKAPAVSPSTSIQLAGAAGGASLVTAVGQRTNGRAVASQAAYFAQGTQVFQAVVLADRIAADAADTFFSGLKFE